MKKKIFSCCIAMMTLLLLSGCPKAEVQSPIFSSTTFIPTFLPSVTSSTTPTFTWTAPDSEVVYQVLGVFYNEISVKEKQILNKQDCVAMWTTGMTGSAGEVSFNNFMVVTNGELTSTPVNGSTLSSGHKYYWAVWGYDKDMSVTHSSGQKSFTP